MNTDTGHLVTNEEFENINPDLREQYEQVPNNLTLSAKLELMGKDETVVGKEATSQIATWARSKRDRLKAKGKSRRMNKLCCQ